MKFSAAALSLCLAPLALAKSVHNVYPVRRDANKIAARKAKAQQQGSLAGLGLAGFGISETTLSEVIIIWVNPGNSAQTTTVNNQVTVTQTVTAGAVATTVAGEAAGTTTTGGGSSSTTVAGTGATHTVTVGGNAGLQFTPSEVKAAVGDMVIFTFLSQNHTATQSAFATPCDALAGGMDSGFQPNPNNTVNPPPQVAMQVMVDTPLWFFCGQKGHCGKGMTFSINPTAEKTQAMFQAMAIAQKGAGAGTAITGNGGAANGSEAAAPAATESTTSLLPLGGSSTTTAAVAGATNGVTTGSGTTLADGSCSCFVQCGSIGAGAFPAVAAQGVGAFGGMPGALPISMAAA